jgi:hypothetical protein
MFILHFELKVFFGLIFTAFDAYKNFNIHKLLFPSNKAAFDLKKYFLLIN